MNEHKYSLYASTISIIGFILQLTTVNDIIKNIILYISIFSLIVLILITLFNNDTIKREKLMHYGNKLILSTREKVILFGGDLSWTDDYIDSIKTLCEEHKQVEIFFPKSKYDNFDNNESMINRIILLQEAGATIYSFEKDFGLRCILLDPDSFNTNDHMEIMITDRVYRHENNPMKNKYTLKHLKYINDKQKNICKSYIANYYYLKNDCGTY